MSNRVIKILVGFILALPILGFAHELLIIIIAKLVDALASGESLYQLVKIFFSSPIHARTMIETLSGIRTQGIIVAGLPGQILHALAPALFIDPNTIAIPAWISAIVDKNSTVLGFYATLYMVEFITIIFGALVLQNGLKKRSIRYVIGTASAWDALQTLIGFFLMAQAIAAAFSLTLSPSLAGLRETGIGVGFSLLLQLDKQRYNWLMDESLPVLIPTLLIVSAIGIAWLIGKSLFRIRVALGKQTPAARYSIAMRLLRKLSLALVLIPLLLLTPFSQRYFGIANTLLTTPVTQAAQVSTSQPTPTCTATPTVAPTPTSTLVTTPTIAPTAMLTRNTNVAATATIMPSRTATPTTFPTLTPIPTPTQVRERQVELARTGNKFSLVVNGRPTYVTGINYNVNYTALPDPVKRQHHQRDFQIMRAAGINVIIGWGIYDQVTLDIARDYGIGVIMPFELDAKGAFENNNYRNQIKSEYRKFVLAYKDAPAVWGWNPGGDELLHRMETENHRTPDKLQSASDFLLELSTLANSLSPNRVSIVKEPRDWYVPYIEESLRRARAQKPAIDPDKYFIYATNTYGKPDGVTLVLNTTRQSVENRLGVAFVVGEFAPFGLARSERPSHYAMMWNTVRETSSIGGFAYVFGPDQPNPHAPNPYDPLRLLVSEFSLVDGEGNPVDGSWSALANQWRASGLQSNPPLNITQ